MKHLSSFTAAVATFAFALPAHSQAAVQIDTHTTVNSSATANVNTDRASASAITPVAAEFTKKIDSKDAKVGDEVAARTTAATNLADGTDLPKGTRLTGTVTSVRAKSSTNNTSHLAFTFDRAVLRDGTRIPLHATLTSLSAPAPFATPAPEDSFATTGATTGGPVTSGATRAATGGPAGGATRSTAAAAAASAGSLAPKSIDSVGETEGTVVQPVASTGLNDVVAGPLANGSYVSDALRVHHYQVANMPGVVLTSQATARESGALDANGQNITVAGGTRMTMNAAVAAH